jgi:hypothetical protein
MNSFDMRRPSKPDYDDALRVTVRRRSVIERILGAWWLLRGGDALPSNDGKTS